MMREYWINPAMGYISTREIDREWGDDCVHVREVSSDTRGDRESLLRLLKHWKEYALDSMTPQMRADFRENLIKRTDDALKRGL